jgi:hypothetical protein
MIKKTVNLTQIEMLRDELKDWRQIERKDSNWWTVSRLHHLEWRLEQLLAGKPDPGELRWWLQAQKQMKGRRAP